MKAKKKTQQRNAPLTGEARRARLAAIRRELEQAVDEGNVAH